MKFLTKVFLPTTFVGFFLNEAFFNLKQNIGLYQTSPKSHLLFFNFSVCKRLCDLSAFDYLEDNNFFKFEKLQKCFSQQS